LRFERMGPVRGFASFRGQRNWPRWWWFSRTGTHVGYESWVERDALMALDADPGVEAVASQPMWLHWADESGRARPSSQRVIGFPIAARRSGCCGDYGCLPGRTGKGVASAAQPRAGRAYLPLGCQPDDIPAGPSHVEIFVLRCSGLQFGKDVRLPGPSRQATCGQSPDASVGIGSQAPEQCVLRPGVGEVEFDDDLRCG
jgi:hypothetical protein